MDNYTFSNLFNFREYRFSHSYSANLQAGTKYNYISYLIKGQADIKGENFHLSLNEGDVVFSPMNSKHLSLWQGNPEVVYRCFGFANYPSNTPLKFETQKIVPNKKIMDYINMLPTDNNISCYTVGIFFMLLDEMFKTMRKSSIGKKHPELEKAMNYISIHPNISVPEVAKYCNISESSLYLLFKNNTDTTPAKFKLDAKLEQAYTYLVSTDMPIEQISSECGFSSSSYFRKKFYEKFKNTPSKERRKNVF